MPDPSEKTSKSSFDLFFLCFCCALMVLVCVGYDVFVISPRHAALIEEGKTLYVVDLNVLGDAHVLQLLKESEQSGATQDEAFIKAKMDVFQQKLTEDLFELSNGFPVFNKGALINAHGTVVDLTPTVASRNGLDVTQSLDAYLQGK